MTDHHHYRIKPELHGAVNLDGRFGPAAEKFARFFGTVRYLAVQTVIVIIWITLNTIGLVQHWDVFPFILLNLIFSTQAAYAAPMILLAQNRQADRDKALETAAAGHRDAIAQQQTELLESQRQVIDAMHALTTEVHELVQTDTPTGVGLVLNEVRRLAQRVP